MRARRMSGHRRKVRRTWTEVLLTVVDGDSPEIPRLRWWDRRAVIGRLDELFDMLKGDVHMHLRWLMFAAHMDKMVLRMLDMRRDADRQLAIEAAGRLRLRQALSRVTAFVADPDPETSILAAQALVRIDPAIGVRRIV